MFVMARPSKETRFPTLTLFVNEDLPIGRITRRPNELPLNHVRERIGESLSRGMSICRSVLCPHDLPFSGMMFLFISLSTIFNDERAM